MLNVVNQLRSMKMRALGMSSERLVPWLCTLVKNTPARRTSASNSLKTLRYRMFALCMTYAELEIMRPGMAACAPTGPRL